MEYRQAIIELGGFATAARVRDHMYPTGQQPSERTMQRALTALVGMELAEQDEQFGGDGHGGSVVAYHAQQDLFAGAVGR